jgi:alpha-1,6-mannosyltransferase
VKILDVNEFYAEQGGGVKTYTNEKLRHAAQLGHELVVVAPGPRDAEEERLGGRVVWVKGPPMPLDPRYYVMYRERAIFELIERECPDVIEGSSSWAAGWIAARYPGPGVKALVYHQDPVAVYPHTLFDRWFSARSIDAACFPYWEYVRRLAHHFDVTVVAGSWLAQRLETFGVPRARAVPFGIDRRLFAPDRRDERLRSELLRRCGLPDSARLLITVSRHHPEKRLGFLFRALALAQRERPLGLVVFGDGPMRRVVEAQARQVAGVHLAGFVNDRDLIARAVASADAMLHGSAAETYGFVVAEALCSGTPVIAPERGGAYELCRPEYSEVYSPGDASSCAAAIARLLGRERSAMSQAAALSSTQLVLEPQQHFARLFELYQSLVNHRSHTAVPSAT